jgi:hypothetical protein
VHRFFHPRFIVKSPHSIGAYAPQLNATDTGVQLLKGKRRLDSAEEIAETFGTTPLVPAASCGRGSRSLSRGVGFFRLHDHFLKKWDWGEPGEAEKPAA